MKLLLVAAAAAMPYPEDVASVVEAVPSDAALPADAAVLTEGEKVDERHHRPQYGSQSGS